jgi:hypothetical protein
MSATAAGVHSATVNASWEAVVFHAAALMLDWWSQAEEPSNLNEALGAGFRQALWAQLVWRSDARLRAAGEETGQTRRYYGPGGLGEVVRGPGGTVDGVASVRAAAWREAVELGLNSLLDGRG